MAHSIQSSLSVTGSITVAGSITGSVTGSVTGVLIGNATSATSATSASFATTASYWSGSITNAVSSSFATTASYWSGSIQNSLSSSFATTASYWSGSIVNAQSASIALTASFYAEQDPVFTRRSGSFATTGSNAFTGSQIIAGDLTVQGTASIAYLNVLIESSSVIYSSGSNQFGDATNDRQTIIGYTTISGSLAVTGSTSIPNLTGSLRGNADTSTSASFATTASWANSSSYSDKSLHTENVLLHVQNNSGADIPKGSVVILSGSSGDNPHIQLADYSTERRSAYTIGFTNETITNGSNGYVITEGRLVGVNTNAFTGGDLLYLGASGSYTNVAPQAPFHTVRLGQVIRVQTNNGSIDVRIDNGYELDELHDVKIISASHGQTIARSGSVWINTNTLNITGSVQGTASHALTASYALNAGSTFPYTGSAEITGSLSVSGSLGVNNGVYINNAYYFNQTTVFSTTGGETKTLYSLPAGAFRYNAMFVDYVIENSGNIRAGQLVVAGPGLGVGTETVMTETTTADLVFSTGTAGFVFSASLQSGNLTLHGIAPDKTWYVETIIRAI